MYVDEVKLNHIKGFKDLSFNLQRPDGTYAGWTVFTGDNGSGKSTLLKAIALGLVGKDVARSLQPSFHRWVSESSNAKDGSIALMLQPEKDVDVFVRQGNTAYKPFQARLRFLPIGMDAQIEEPEKKASAHRGPWALPQSSGWFSCGYGPFRRVFGASPEATRLMVGPMTERYVTMFQEATSLYEVDAWLKNLNHKKLEQQAGESKLLDLIIDILRDDLMPNEITVDKVDSDGLWLRDRNGLRLAWSEMSDGYRAALALLTDILRHLVKTYGNEGLAERRNDRWVIVRPGVVMIDEIDAHLHPEWQQKIGFWLKSRFPNIQFLVTTHSPIICQAADPNGLFVLPEPASGFAPRALTADEYQRVISSRPDTILLSPAFGLQNTRSEKAVEARAAYAKIKAKRNAGAQLSPQESSQLTQLKLFVSDEDES